MLGAMANKPGYQRQTIKTGTVGGWPTGSATKESVATRARYRPSGKHKDYPAPAGEWKLVPPIADAAKCAHFSDPVGAHRDIERVLREAIEAGVVDLQFRGDFPARVWAKVNGTVHEARLENQETGEYHGFPLNEPLLHPHDPRGLLETAPSVELDVLQD